MRKRTALPSTLSDWLNIVSNSLSIPEAAVLDGDLSSCGGSGAGAIQRAAGRATVVAEISIEGPVEVAEVRVKWKSLSGRRKQRPPNAWLMQCAVKIQCTAVLFRVKTRLLSIQKLDI